MTFQSQTKSKKKITYELKWIFRVLNILFKYLSQRLTVDFIKFNYIKGKHFHYILVQKYNKNLSRWNKLRNSSQIFIDFFKYGGIEH